jgi:hypothetical protein
MLRKLLDIFKGVKTAPRAFASDPAAPYVPKNPDAPREVPLEYEEKKEDFDLREFKYGWAWRICSIRGEGTRTLYY